MPDELLEVVESGPVAQRQALQAAAHHSTDGLGLSLSGRSAEGSDGGRHVRRIEQLGRVRIDDAAERFFAFRPVEQSVPAVLAALMLPLAAALRDEPQARDVAQESDRAADAAFVRETARQGSFVDDGLGGLHAHQAPGSAADIGAA